MTLPGKSRRKITVDDVDYHWIATSAIRGTEEAVYTIATLIVERAEQPGQRLQVAFDSRALYEPSPRAKYVDYLALTPGVVAAAIRYARAQGWTPEDKGADFRATRGEALFEAELRAALQKGSRWGEPPPESEPGGNE